MIKNGLGIYIICKDEIAVIDRLITSIQDIAEQIVIVDTGSTDGTLQYLKECKLDNLELCQMIWQDDFSLARNAALSRITTEYAMWLDCDDKINSDTQEFLKHFNKYAELNPSDIYVMKYLISRNTNGEPGVSMGRIRITKTDRKFKWEGFLHEYLVTDDYGKIKIPETFFIEHDKIKAYDNRNIKMYDERIEKAKIDKKYSFTPREQVYYGNELYYAGRYNDAIKQLTWCVVNEVSWFGDMIECCIKLYKMHTDNNEKYKWLMTALRYGDSPRPDIACMIGDFFYDNKRVTESIPWYEIALVTKFDRNDRNEIVDDKYLSWYPHLALSVAYWSIDKQKAKFHHDYGINNYPEVLFFQRNKSWFNNI